MFYVNYNLVNTYTLAVIVSMKMHLFIFPNILSTAHTTRKHHKISACVWYDLGMYLRLGNNVKNRKNIPTILTTDRSECVSTNKKVIVIVLLFFFTNERFVVLLIYILYMF